jgi:exodeoxyribonuclease V gamma subunit
MQLHQLKLSSFKKFNELTLEFGRNTARVGQLVLISGVNESGKSTLSDALRFALVGTSRSGASASKLRPQAYPQATPELALQFSHDGTEYAVRRKLGERGETSLVAGVGGIERMSSNDSAEWTLQQFFAGTKTPRKASVNGLPQALWMSQGEFATPILDGSADSTLRDALSAALGQMLGKAERWRQQIQQELGTIEGARGPIGDYRKLLANRFELNQAHQKAKARLADFSKLQVEYAALTLLLQNDAELNSLNQQQSGIDARRLQIQGLERQRLLHERARAEQSSLQAQQQSQINKLAKLESDQAALLANRQQLALLAQTIADQSSEQAQLAAQKSELELTVRRLEQAQKVAVAQAAHADWQQLDAIYQRAIAQRRRDTPALAEARVQLRLQLDALKLLEQEISLCAQLAGFNLQLSLASTGWQLERAGKSESLHADAAQADKLTLASQGEALRLLAPDGSSIHIETRQVHAVQSAQALRIKRKALLTDIAQQASLLSFPSTPTEVLAALEQDTQLRAEANAVRDEARRAAGPLQIRLGLHTSPTPSEVKQALADAEVALAQQLRAAKADPDASLQTHAQRESALSQQRALLSQVQTKLTQSIERARYQNARELELQQQAGALIVDPSAITQAKAALAEIDEQLRAVQARVSLSEADAQSFEAQQIELESAILRHRQGTQQHNALSAKKQELLGQLRGVGQQELHQQEAELASQLSEASALADSQTRRFEALKHLLNLCNAEKAAFEARIAEPLYAKLAPYLTELFGADAELILNQQLQPERLARAGGEFNPSDLSLGTREQLAVLVRIAYADVLADAGYPTLLILDDVLNFSDSQRRNNLMRVLEMAAVRHCIVLLSCNPEHWRSLQVDQHIELANGSVRADSNGAASLRSPIRAQIQRPIALVIDSAQNVRDLEPKPEPEPEPEPRLIVEPEAVLAIEAEQAHEAEPESESESASEESWFDKLSTNEPNLALPLIEPRFSGPQNLIVVHGQKLEALALALWARVEEFRRTNPAQILCPLCVIVGHTGMARWLKYDLAKRTGIAANIEFLLPSEWVERSLTLQRADAEQTKQFHTDSLRMAIYELLKNSERFTLAPALVADPRNRFSLAETLAVRFTQYLVYRSDWLLALEAGAPLRQARTSATSAAGAPAEHFASSWQAKLWLALVDKLGPQHRARRRQALLTSLTEPSLDEASSPPRAPLFCFGLNQLAPDDLTLLRAYSSACPVVIFFPNPCQEYWADLQTRPKLQHAFKDAAQLENDFGLELGHPLLSQLGKHGQMLFAQLSDCTDQFFEIDLDLPEQASALAALQLGINELAPAQKSAANICESVQILAADSALSELEAIAERLHQCFHADDSLALEDVVIMAPNISRYAPMLAHVFAQQLRADGSELRPAIAYSVLDSNPLQQPVLQRLLMILQLPNQAISRESLLQCLALPELMQRFMLDEALVAQMQACLEKGYFESALSAKDWADQLAINVNEHSTLSINTLDQALARLWLGYWSGRDGQAIAGQYPVPELDSAAFEALSKLSTICAELKLFVISSRFDRTPSEWASWLSERIDALLDFSADLNDSTTLAGRTLPMAALDAFVVRTDSLTLSPLPYAVLLAELERALSSSHWPIARMQPQLEQGGVVCCGMVPMRTLPYKVVCVLGLQQGEFPRQQMPDSSDWLRKPGLMRLGDRHTGAEDNYLLLEALLAARSKLFLSYVAIDASTGESGEPCAALAAVISQLSTMQKPGEPEFCLDVSMPAGANLAFQHIERPLAPELAYGEAQNYRSGLAIQDAANSKVAISIDALIAFWKNPTRYFLNAVLQAAPRFESLEPEDDLSTRVAPNEFIETALVQYALKQGWQSRPSWLMQSGKIRFDAIGEAQLQQASSAALKTWQTIELASAELLGPAPTSVLARFNIALDVDESVQLHGVIAGVYANQARLLQLNGRGANALDAIALQIKLACLQLQCPDTQWRGALPNHGTLQQIISAPPDPAAFLSEAIAGMRSALRAPLLFWPRLALVHAQKQLSQTECIGPKVLLSLLGGNYEFEFNAGDNQLLMRALGLQAQQAGADALAFFDTEPVLWQQFSYWRDFWFTNVLAAKT